MNDSPLIILTDIHGAYYTMLRLLNRAPKPCRLILLGDLIDRGPHSRKVVEFAMNNNIPTTMGNHEDLALAFYDPHPATLPLSRRARCGVHYSHGIWLDNGGDVAVPGWKTIDKRQLTGPQIAQAEMLGGRVPDSVLDWMKGLPAYIAPDVASDANGRRLLASHTGYGLDADKGDWLRALWGRREHGDGYWVGSDPASGEEIDDGYYRVFGHSRVTKAEVTEMWVNIDTGAAYNGHMTGIIWPSKQLIVEPYNETPISPLFSVRSGVVVPL